MKAFFNTKSIVGRVLIVSLLAGGLVFAGAFAVNIFVPTPTEASDCCGGSESELATDGVSSKLEGCCGSAKGNLTVTSEPCNCMGNSTCSTSTCSSSSSCSGTNSCKSGCGDNKGCGETCKPNIACKNSSAERCDGTCDPDY
ncbi:hypothetical protein J4G07_04070 [Candidatus Poribacteria bacterium]|nr:hypothetical protein [Candidatus Poribacteria bacterium]